MATTRTRRRDGQEGVALMVVLLFVLLLGVIVAEYAYETEVDASLAANHKGELQAYVAAKSAVAAGLGLLQDDVTQGTGTDGKQTSGAPDTIAIDSLWDTWVTGIPYEAINDSVMQCRIVDETGKLNLNSMMMVQTSQKQDGSVSESQDEVDNPVLVAALRQLFADMGVEEDPTDAILDWIDRDDDPRPNGAESDYYAAMDPPYACKNGKMDSIEELLLIKGITPEIYFDCTANVQGLGTSTYSSSSSSSSSAKDNSGSVGPVCLADLLTVHGDIRGRVNVNTARQEVLAALCAALMGGNQASVDTMLQARDQAPFENLEDVQSRGGLSVQPGSGSGPGPVQDSNGGKKQDAKGPNSGDGQTPPPGQQGGLDSYVTVSSSMFRIWGDGLSNDVMVRVEAFVHRDTNMAIAQGGYQPPSGGTRERSSSSSTSSKPSAFGNLEFGLKQSVPELFRIVDWRVMR